MELYDFLDKLVRLVRIAFMENNKPDSEQVAAAVANLGRLPSKATDSLKKIAELVGCDNSSVERWDRTGYLEIAGLVFAHAAMGGRKHTPTSLGYAVLKVIK